MYCNDYNAVNAGRGTLAWARLSNRSKQQCFGLRVDHELVGDDNKKQQGFTFMVFYDFYVNSYICWLQMYGDGIYVSTDPCKAHEHVTPI